MTLPHVIARAATIDDVGGFSLMEAIVATIIAVLAIVGLAYTFGIGRSNVDRFDLARIADARAQSLMEFVSVVADTAPADSMLSTQVVHQPTPATFAYHGETIGSAHWRVASSPPEAPLAIRYSVVRVTTVVEWTWGGIPDSVSYSRIVALR